MILSSRLLFCDAEIVAFAAEEHYSSDNVFTKHNRPRPR